MNTSAPLMMMSLRPVTVPVEYIPATTVVVKLPMTMSMSSNRMIHRGVVFTLNVRNTLRFNIQLISRSIIVLSCANNFMYLSTNNLP